MPERNPPLVTSWVVVTFKKPLQWSRADDEVWMFNPHVRYVLNHHQLEGLKPFIATISELKTGGNYRQLNSSTPLQGARILIERYRDRGIGDLLFLSPSGSNTASYVTINLVIKAIEDFRHLLGVNVT